MTLKSSLIVGLSNTFYSSCAIFIITITIIIISSSIIIIWPHSYSIIASGVKSKWCHIEINYDSRLYFMLKCGNNFRSINKTMGIRRKK